MDRDEPFLRHINARCAEAPIIGFVRSDEDKTMMRIGTGLAAAALILGAVAAPDSAMAQTKADQCASYAKQAAAGTLRIREKSFSLTDLIPSEAVEHGIVEVGGGLCAVANGRSGI